MPHNTKSKTWITILLSPHVNAVYDSLLKVGSTVI